MTEPAPRARQNDGRVHGVVGAVRDKHGRWLMIRRSAMVRLAPLKVCFPGGVIEVGETQPQALAREFQEELGIVVEPLNHVWRFDWPDKPLTIWGWTAQWLGGDLSPNDQEVAEVLWLSSEEGTAHPDGLATNAGFIGALSQRQG